MRLIVCDYVMIVLGIFLESQTFHTSYIQSIRVDLLCAVLRRFGQLRRIVHHLLRVRVPRQVEGLSYTQIQILVAFVPSVFYEAHILLGVHRGVRGSFIYLSIDHSQKIF